MEDFSLTQSPDISALQTFGSMSEQVTTVTYQIQGGSFSFPTVDGRNPAKQLRLVVYPIIYDGFCTSEVVGNGISEPSTISR